MGWLKGKSTGNQRFSHEIWDFPEIFPLNQPIDIQIDLNKTPDQLMVKREESGQHFPLNKSTETLSSIISP